MNILLNISEQTETSVELGKALVNFIEENLDLEKWDFQLSFSDFSKMSRQKLIYDSPFCRVSFSFSRQRLPKYDELSIKYGRLHASNDGSFMVWQGQECHCWHLLWEPLKFLDGLSAREVIEQENVQKHLPEIISKFKESAVGIKLRNEYPPKYAITLESVIWRQYGQKLFDLFDLRKPDLWTHYQDFLKEYYRLLDKKVNYGPPHENVC